MQATKPPRDQQDERVSVQPLDFTAQTFSDLECKNRTFKRIAWAAALLLIGVITVLVLQLADIIN
jgi:hypothetical protein